MEYADGGDLAKVSTDLSRPLPSSLPTLSFSFLPSTSIMLFAGLFMTSLLQFIKDSRPNRLREEKVLDIFAQACRCGMGEREREREEEKERERERRIVVDAAAAPDTDERLCCGVVEVDARSTCSSLSRPVLCPRALPSCQVRAVRLLAALDILLWQMLVLLRAGRTHCESGSRPMGSGSIKHAARS
jgi:hypothetical protein